ncbi:MAG: PorT family protein [Cytophagaceae bacterium]|nr:PorT family protein [Cytophagaceae bacterium]
MKKAILILAAICISNLSMAQFTLGIKGGINFSSMVTNAGSFSQNIKESKDTKTGYSFGVYSRIGKKLYLQPEVLFATKGGKVDFVPVGGGSPVSVDIKTNNIDIPILIGYKLFNRIRINAGPVASIKISEDQKFLDELKKVTNDVDAAFENATFGYQAGVGIKLLGFEIDLRNEGSLSNLSSDKFNDPKFSQRLTGWQLTIGHKIL